MRQTSSDRRAFLASAGRFGLAAALGLGVPTGIELDREAAGLLPDEAWKRATRREGWWAGDTCNVSIGQGALLTTPLQMAVATV